MQLVLSLALLAVSVVAFRFAMPVGGEVRPYLRNDDVQSYYAVLLVLGLVFGLLSSIFGIVQLVGGNS
jgi:hypothetical protein